jgi:2'-5' RNA ligase
MNTGIKKRCIMIFPQFKNINIIDEIREKYDPLAKNVRPHVTLVFPFQSSIGKVDLQNNLLKSLEGVKCFNLTLEEIIKIDNKFGLYLFLGVTEGTEKVKELYQKLNSGIVKNYNSNWVNEGEFMPHMTIGNFEDRNTLNDAYVDVCSIKDSFNTLVEKISVEIIDENEDSIIEMEVNLSK